MNETELGCVIGHEIGHISRRHHLSVLQKSQLADASTNALSISSKTAGSAQMGKQLPDENKTSSPTPSIAAPDVKPMKMVFFAAKLATTRRLA